MKLDNEFRVSAPIERAWEVLTDIPAITPCLPGAELTDHDGDEYTGTVKIKVGPVTSNYSGKALFAVVDEERHHVEIAADGRDSHGSGNASATITADMPADGDDTKVTITTDLKIAGKVAQFGKGMIAEVSGKLIDQFVDCIEQELLGDKVIDEVAVASADAGGATTPASRATPTGRGPRSHGSGGRFGVQATCADRDRSRGDPHPGPAVEAPVTGAELFAGVDRALFAATYAARLRRAGIDVAFTSVERCAASLDAVGPLTLGDAYWVLRLSFVTRHQDLLVFDKVFEAVFDVLPNIETGWVPTATHDPPIAAQDDDDADALLRLRRPPTDAAPTVTALPWSTLPAASDEDGESDESDEHLALPELQPAADAVDMDRPFDLLDDAELERLGELLEASANSWPHRRSRRRRPARSGGRVALRRTMRTAMRTGGEVMSLAHERRQHRPRPVVVLLDVSGSMERHARIYLHLIRPLALVHRAEVFAFATDLTRITPALRSRGSSDVIDHMNETVGDRFSGTRVATSVRTLLHHRTWSTSLRGAVVLVCSDGWDADAPADLRARHASTLVARASHRLGQSRVRPPRGSNPAPAACRRPSPSAISSWPATPAARCETWSSRCRTTPPDLPRIKPGPSRRCTALASGGYWVRGVARG